MAEPTAKPISVASDAPTMKQGIAGAGSYDQSKVFDPSKLKGQTPAESPAIAGFPAGPKDGVSTLAGSNYYRQNQIPGTDLLNRKIAGYEPGTSPAPQAPAIAGDPRTAAQPLGGNQQPPAIAGPLATAQQAAPAIAGFGSAGAGASAPGGASLFGSSRSIAGMTPDNLQIAGKMMDTGMSGNGIRRMDSLNQQAIAGIGQSGNSLMDNRGRSYNEQVAHAAQVNEAGQRDLMRMSPREQAAAETAGNANFGSFIRGGARADLTAYEARKNSIAGQLADNQAQRIAGIKASGDKYASDQTLAGHLATANATVAAAGVKADVDTNKATQTALGKQQEQGQKEYSERVKGLMSDWSKLHLPPETTPKLNYYARIHAESENPNGKLFMMAPNRDGGQYAALHKAYEPHYQGLLKSGMSHNDAAARVYGVAKKNGHVVDVPDFNLFKTKKSLEG